MSREELIRSFISLDGNGLEIGPSYNPIAAKRLGYKVEVLDHASTEELRAKYSFETNVNASMIEDVDFIWDDKSLCSTIGKTGCYDYIVASHVIEHIPDMLGFLRDSSSLLKESGRLILAVPDMRRCFDAFRPLSSVGPILQAHAEKRLRHVPSTAFDHVAYMANLDGVAGWSQGAIGKLEAVNTLRFAKDVFDRSQQSSLYYDFHAWVFTPSSFRLIIADLFSLEQINLQISHFEPTSQFEFIAILTKNGLHLETDRSNLLNKIRLELFEWPAV